MKDYLSYGLDTLKKISKSSLDNDGFKNKKYKTTYLLFKIFYPDKRMV